MQSGIVESYALGLATSEEVGEFEQLLPHYPELKDALLDFEYHLELFSIDHEVPPPPEIRQRVEDRLREVPVLPHQGRRQYRRHGTEYVQVKETSEHIRVHRIWRKLFIALVVLAKILLALAIFYFLEYRHAEKQINRLSAPGEPAAAPGVKQN